MLIVHIYVHVKPESVEPFKKASIENARHSVQEPGIARFDVIQDTSDPTQFLLIEHYRKTEARAKHRETAHYLTWRDTVADWMAEPRSSKEYVNIYPPDEPL